MAGESNQQSQIQQQSINISVASSGDVELERRIFSEVHSAGRQLRRLSEIVNVLLTRELSQHPTLKDEAPAKAAIEEFAAMREDILKAKSAFQTDRVINQLATLQKVDAAEFDKARTQLLAWLNTHSNDDSTASALATPALTQPGGAVGATAQP